MDHLPPTLTGGGGADATRSPYRNPNPSVEVGGKPVGGCKVQEVLLVRRTDVPEPVAEIFDSLDFDKDGIVKFDDIQKEFSNMMERNGMANPNPNLNPNPKEFSNIMERNGMAEKLGASKMPSFMKVRVKAQP